MNYKNFEGCIKECAYFYPTGDGGSTEHFWEEE